MNQEDNTQEEITTIENVAPQQVVHKVTRQVEPVAKGDAPQKVYETKKTIFRFNQIIWYIVGFIEVLLIFRIVLKAVGANAASGFANLIYSVTSPLADPFRGILGVSTAGAAYIEWSTIVAALVYICIAWGLVYLLDIIYPVTPKDIEAQ